MREITFRARRSQDTGQEPLFGHDPDEGLHRLTQYATHLMRQVHNTVSASSAIRTKPLRTYTPGSETKDSEGTHVPYEMAKLYRAKNKESWKRLKESLERYGQSSQMFSEVHIKSFGTTSSDPFQIQLSQSGPKTNIIDLGYGTSQVLPVIYDVASAGNKTIFLIQQPEVHLHPKAQAALGTYFVDSYLIDRKNFLLETHSDFIVDRIRNCVLRGTVEPDDVALLFFQRGRLENHICPIPLTNEGSPLNPPDAYRSFFIDEQMKILGVE